MDLFPSGHLFTGVFYLVLFLKRLSLSSDQEPQASVQPDILLGSKPIEKQAIF